MTFDLNAIRINIIRINSERVLMFTKQLYFLLNAGIPLFRAIQIIQAQTTDLKLLNALKSISAGLAEGQSFQDSLARFPESFSDFYRNMISVGENRGELAEAMKRIHSYLQSAKELKEKIVNALTYPIILLFSGGAVLFMMMVFVLPKFADIFTNSSVALPLPTKILIYLSKILTQYYLVFIGIFALLAIGLTLLQHYPRTRYWLDKSKLELPILGQLILIINVSRFCRSMGILYNSGVQLLPTIELSKASLGNLVLEKEIDKLRESVRDGKGIAVPLSKSKIFPPMMAQMIAVGEETGELEKVLLDVASYYEQETDFQMKRQLALLEPLALMVISILVTFIASAVLLPLFKMSSAIRAF